MAAHELYQPLDASKCEMRLLELQPSKIPDDTIECLMVTVSLNDNIDYIALSYVWGDRDACKPIFVGCTEVLVTVNLELALKQIRSSIMPGHSEENGRLLLWVDALCINQQSVEERNHQVAQMANIYKDARSVIAWLGLHDDSSILAVDTIKVIDAVMPQGWGEHHRGLQRDSASYKECYEWMTRILHIWQLEDPLTSDNKYWTSITEFLGRPYWSRCWIVQEVALARSLTILVGHDLLPWDSMHRLYILIVESLDIDDSIIPAGTKAMIKSTTGDSFCSVAWLRARYQALRKISVIQGFMQGQLKDHAGFFYTVPFLSSDPRDKIFAFHSFGMINHLPDYSKDTETVYCEFSTDLVQSPYAVRYYWNLAGVGFEPCSELTLPSWVVDWQNISQKRMVPRSFPPPKGTFRSNERLPPRGIKVDPRIHLISFGYLVDEITKAYPQYVDLESMYNSCLRKILRDFKHGPPSGRREKLDPMGLVFRTVTEDCSASLRDHSSVNNFPRVIQLATEFLRLFYRCEKFGKEATKPRFAQTFLKAGDSDGRFPQYCHDCFFPDIPWCSEEESLWPKSGSELCDEKSVVAVNYAVELMMDVTRSLKKRLFSTSHGRLVSGPCMTQPGDKIFVLPSCEVPVILRPVEDHYVLVGSCFVLGLLDGEVADMVEKEGLEPVRIEIW